MKVRAIVAAAPEAVLGKEVVVKGWVRTLRAQKALAFIEVNDGSTKAGLQAVAADLGAALVGGEASRSLLTTGAAVSVTGTVVASPGKGQAYKLAATSVEVVGGCAGNYPLQKKRHGLEFLRSVAHLRPRTNTLGAVARVRSALAFATHEYFQKEGFTYLQPPLITGSDCEGAGELFRVTTLPLDDVGNMPLMPLDAAGSAPEGKGGKRSVDFSKDFFGRPTFLTVSGQLSGEAFASALGDV